MPADRRRILVTTGRWNEKISGGETDQRFAGCKSQLFSASAQMGVYGRQPDIELFGDVACRHALSEAAKTRSLTVGK